MSGFVEKTKIYISIKQEKVKDFLLERKTTLVIVSLYTYYYSRWTSSEAKQTNRPHRLILWLMILFYFITFWLNEGEARKYLQELNIWFVFLINYFPRLHRWLIIFLLGINSLIKDDTLKQPPDLTGTTSSTDGICNDDHQAADLIISDIFPAKYFLETLETWRWSLLKFLL